MTADFTDLPDLASRALGGGVVHANDDFFAARENLVVAAPPVHDPTAFGPRGKLYDGWETRRRRESGHDFALVRLGVPGTVDGVVVDTAFFTGNYPPEVSVEATAAEEYPSVEELLAADWTTLVPRSPVVGDTANRFPVDDARRYTHVRLSIHPDGGVARLRVHGRPAPDPALLTGTIDLAALENGADVVACSDTFYASARNLLLPGRVRNTSEGWENARRRDGGHDYVTVRLAAAGVVRRAVVDASYFIGNAPGWVSLHGLDARTNELDDVDAWFEMLPRTRLQPDTRHQLRVAVAAPATHVRLDVFPDGGLARLRVLGELSPGGPGVG